LTLANIERSDYAEPPLILGNLPAEPGYSIGAVFVIATGMLGLNICYNPTLITEPKTFHIQRISTLLGLKIFCHFRR
jgi:hypothetical protein